MSNDTVIASLQEKIDDLNQQAWEARVNDSPKAFQLSQESVNLARNINYRKGLAEGLRSLGFGYIRLFKNDEAAPLLREALSLFQSLKDVRGQAIVYEYLGIIERNWGNLGGSLELLLKGHALLRQVGSADIEVTSCYQIGVTYKHLGNHENALDYLYRALSIAKKSNIPLMEGYAINIIGSIYFDNGNYKDALDCYQQGLVIRQESHDKWGEAGSLDNIGITYLKLNDLDKAIDYCKQSLEMTRSTNDKKGEANTLLHLAEIFRQAGDTGQAAKFSNESLEIRKARGDKRGEAEVLLFLADLYKNRSDTADHQIYEWLSAAFKIADEIQAQDLLSKACYNLHEYYSQKGNHKDSLIQLEAHLQIEKELHKNTINQKVANLEISHKAEVISERNRELIELNEKIETANAELRIEASLERVRAVAMGMKEPADMINVCRMISDQLQQLGFKEIRNVQTAIIYPQKHEYLNYQYFTPYDKESIETINYWLHPDVLEFTNQMLSSPDAYYHKTFQGEELSEWREYRKKTNQLPDPKLDKTNSSHYYFYSIGSGALGVTTYAPLNEGQIGLFKRFRNVFELAYRRFIDIEKALAQAREAQIEAALERVRAKSMAMHHSDDLITVINVVQEQLLGLGFHFHGANFVTDYSEKGYTMWLASPSESFPYKIYVPQIGQKYFEAVKEAIEKGSDFATYSLNFEEKNTYFKNLFENSLAKNTSEQGKRMVYESKGMAASVVLLDKVRLNLMNLDMIPFTDEENNILRRFGWVFEQSYTRFLDLQKAEAQAREAQIETGLERVRSKTMAMHKSEEVTDVAVSLNEELLKLGFEGGSTIIIMDKETGGTEQWTGFSEDKSLKSCYVPYFKHPCHEAQLSAWKKGEEFLVYTVTGDEKRTLDEHYFTTGYKDFPESDKRWMRQMESVTFSHAFMKYGAIHWGPGHLTEEQLRILQRFSKVFEQSYTRFLDLQKAEAQARDAQIEAALERVRSRTMGMHKSDELPEAANLLFQQIQALDIPVFGTGYNIWEDDKKAVTSWMSSEGIIQPSFSLPLTEETSLIECYEAGQKGDQFFVQELSGAKLFSHLSYMQKLPVVGEVMKKMAEAGLPLPEYMINHHAFFSHGYLLFITYKPVPDAHDIFKRFAKVFDQTYTRFLDLQKAEAQAREAQIEVALERIRARAMAMHSSNELMDVANILREQMGLLDQPDLETSVVNLFEEDSELIFSWNASRVPGSSEKIISSITSFPKNSSELTREMMSLYHSGEKEYTLEAAGFKLMEFLKVLIKANPRVADYIGDNPPEKVFYHFTTFTGGNLLTVSYQPPAEETKSLQRRAASVFDMAYRRYLDLKKAEAQTREAQTEVALERIRARAMAMHSSYELMDVAHILREQMGMLDQPDLETSVINLFDEDSDYIHSWHAFREPGSSSGKTINGTVSFRKDSSALTREMIDHYHSGEKEYTLEATGEKLNEFIQVLTNSEPEISNYIGKNPPGRVYYHFATFAGGALLTVSYQPTNEDVKLLQRRAASVFELAYRRYLDLKKAEAQTREAQIEVAVERVRAKALAMHKSEDLHSVVVTLKKELMSLQIPEITAATIYLAQDDASIRILDLSDTGGDNDDDQPQLKLDKIFRLEDTDPDLWIRRMWDRNENYFVLEADEDDFVRVVQWIRTVDPAGAEVAEKIIREKSIKKAWLPTVKLGKGIMNIDLLAPPAPEIESILLKMGAGFDLAYKRFLDLQNAEAQAREAQIEAAVEKVRSRSLAMHKSDELQEVVHTVFERLKELNVDFYTAIIILFKEGSKDIIWWLESKANQQYSRILVPFTPVPYFIDLFETRESGGDLFSKCYSFVEKNELFNHLFQNTDFKYVPEKQKHFLQATEFATMSVALAKNTGIHITSYSKKSFSDQDNQIVSKFANVFDQAYTRFLDLQKAEAQAREAQIEAALERVRAKVMAMSNSNDLNETSLVFGEQLRKLGIDWQFAYFWLVDESKNENTFWITWPDSKTSFTTYTLAEAETYFNDCLISWRAGVKIHDNYVPPEGVKQWIDTFQRIADDAGGEAKRIMVPQTFADGVYYYDAMMKYGSFGICISKPATDEEKKIQCRFAIEFERAYTRFLDLKQAEAQAREAKIEAALERVRARAMAMHKSDDLKMAVATVFEELDKLNIGILRCGIAIMDKDKPRADVWITVKSEQTNTIQVSGDESLDYHPLLRGAYDGWVRQEDFSYVLQGEDLLSYYRDVASIKYQLPVSSPFDKEKVDQQQYYFNAVFQDGSLFAFMEAAITDEAKTVMKRFANVFNLTYKRFLDLQKAEAQAREAQIELGLERVRARAMAMQKSGELKELIATVSTELSKLDVILDRCFLMIYDFKTLGVTWWMANPETSSDPIGLYVKYHEQAPYLAFLKAWQDRLVKWQYLLEGSAKKTWDEFLFVETELSRLPGFVIDNMRANDKVYLSASFNNFGCLTLATLEPLSDEQFDIMLRFAKVFDLTYTRFNDLKQAEAQARAAKIEAALERVRARALAMQEPEELKDVAQVLRTEMGLLGVEELETCSIYINDESAEKAECWYALKDIRSGEKKLVNDHFALNLSETWVGREMLQFYQSPQKQISIIMQGENRKEWIHYCEEHSAPLRGYYGEVIPDRTYHLYKFSHGAIGAAAAGDISEESWRMLGRAASVFSLAYSRFKDLTQARIDLIKLKEEKKRAEEALTELQATQKQLIQSEKMASLGELTAGIAHEIQNPLNFVNNFSDVSNELLEEMKQELATGNTQQAIEIVNGVKENLEKILHHGKRADAIVKGMLQHSRASSGQKELIDINMLAEEYLRLAYHGLRAKDKFFNAKFETDLDPSLHKINVVPQEIGRVILNLINNAFYAVTEKKKSLPSLPKGGQEKSSNDYEPIVTVRTRRHGPPPAGGDRGSVEIRVVDNGYGIPQKVLDKIFQPFFTTKPTGQGTGLGLSLSYDIITKGHQGEIKVNTKENEGTEFTIILPE